MTYKIIRIAGHYPLVELNLQLQRR